MASNSQIDKLGERLRKGSRAREDLVLLEDFRASFAPGHDAVREVIEQHFGLGFSSRASKTNASIVAKLKRSKTRLSRMQDVAGLRVVVKDRTEQNSVVARFRHPFPDSKISLPDDPRTGYRAVHLIVPVTLANIPAPGTRFVEVQVRTLSQHSWAQCSEALSDVFGIELKYGGAQPEVQTALKGLADILDSMEDSGLPLHHDATLSLQNKRFCDTIAEAVEVEEPDDVSAKALFHEFRIFMGQFNALASSDGLGAFPNLLDVRYANLLENGDEER